MPSRITKFKVPARALSLFMPLGCSALFSAALQAQTVDSGHLDVGTIDAESGFNIVGDANGGSIRGMVGVSVGGGGDFDGDGFDDLLVTANSTYPARTWLLYGSEEGLPDGFQLSDVDGANGFMFLGENDSGAFPVLNYNHRADFIGDFNGDGFDDFVVGISTYSDNLSQSTGTGAVYVVLGQSQWKDWQMPELPATYLFGVGGFQVVGLPGDYIGHNVTGGDFNGDGYADIAFSAVGRDQNKGGAYVIYGGSANMADPFNVADLDGSNGYVIEGIELDNEDVDVFGNVIVNGTTSMGWALSNLGDVNGDDLDDLGIMGLRQVSPAGRSGFVVYGHQRSDAALALDDITAEQGVKLIGNMASVAGIGDLNNDGLGDFVTNHLDLVEEQYSSGWVIYGSEEFGEAIDFTDLDQLQTQGFAIVSPTLMGVSGAPAGDVNGDGLQDSLIFDGSFQSSMGAMAVLYGSSQRISGALDIDTDLDGSNGVMVRDFVNHNLRYFAVAADGIGDFNGDGFDDIIAGTPQTTAYHDQLSYLRALQGGALVIYGASDLNTSRQTEESLLKDLALGHPLSQVSSTSGEESTAILSASTATGLGERAWPRFTVGDDLLLAIGVVPELEDQGKAASIHLVMHVVGGDWYMLNSNGQFVAWDQSLATLEAAFTTDSLSAQEYYQAVQGSAELGEYEFYLAYSTDADSNGTGPASLHFNGEPLLLFVDPAN